MSSPSIDSSVETENREGRSILGILFHRVASRPVLAFLLPFLMVLIGRAILLTEVPPPQPLIEDEFSYLLAGETFASFRLTNPPHPLWQHFETIHELMLPTYMSKYPPMQGLCLAFGQVIFGMPWMGVLLTMAIFCGLLPWVFRAWLPCGWALAGAMLATSKIGIMSYWTESFWGGGAAAIGGALVLGSIRRLAIMSTPGMGAVFVFGCGILANSRPFEGAILVLGCLGYLLGKWFGSGRWRVTWPSYPLRLVPVACLVGFPILLAMGYYNFRVTGKVTEFPYQTFEKQYSVWTAFIWQKNPSPEPVYRQDFIRREWIEFDSAHKAYERRHLIWVHWRNFLEVTYFYFGPMFFLGGFLFIPALGFGAKNRVILGLLTSYYIGEAVICEILPHYTAPAAALIYLGMTAALRTTWHVAPGGFPLGKTLVLIVVAVFFLLTALLEVDLSNRFLYPKPHLVEKRQAVLSFLDQQPGLQLVFVRHGPLHDVNDVWTFNHADIDASRIIWANFMSPAENQQVLDYYAAQHRTVWMLDDDAEFTFRPYGSPTEQPIIEMENPPYHPFLLK